MTAFSAIGDGLTDDTAAINSFLASNMYGCIPSGVFRVSGPLNFRSGQKIWGCGDSTVILPTGSMTDCTLNLSSIQHVMLSDFRITAPSSPTLKGVKIDNAKNVKVSGIRFEGGGGYPVSVNMSSDCLVEDIYITGGYSGAGIQAYDSKGVTISRAKVFAQNQGHYGIIAHGGERVKIIEAYVEKTPDEYFGIHAWGCNYAIIQESDVRDTRREAIAVGGRCIGAKVLFNTCEWMTNVGVGDFGISVSGSDEGSQVTDFLLEGNSVTNSAFDGIAIGGFAQRGKIVLNDLRDCCYANAPECHAGVKLYGWLNGAGTTDMLVAENSMTRIDSPGMFYSVYEAPGKGYVARNTVARNKPFGLASSPVFLSSPTSVNLA